MARYTMTAAVFSAAVLAACAQSPNHADVADDLRAGRTVCKYEAPFGSKIRRKTCRQIDDLTRDEKEDIMRTYEQRPKIEGYGQP